MSAELNGRRLSLVRLHSPMHVPTVRGLNTGNTLSADSSGSKESVFLTKVQGGVHVQVKTTGLEAFVPDGNIINVVFEQE